jgi:hypothetical protein
MLKLRRLMTAGAADASTWTAAMYQEPPVRGKRDVRAPERRGPSGAERVVNDMSTTREQVEAVLRARALREEAPGDWRGTGAFARVGR